MIRRITTYGRLARPSPRRHVERRKRKRKRRKRRRRREKRRGKKITSYRIEEKKIKVREKRIEREEGKEERESNDISNDDGIRRDDSYESAHNASGLSGTRNYRFGDANKLAGRYL